MAPFGGTIRVLHVDDESDLRTAVSTHLERVHDDVTVTSESSAREGLERLDDTRFDCIVSDHGMSEMNGLEFLREVRTDYPDLPFVLFTGKGNEEIASEAISAGVTEYLQKGDGVDQYTVLANRIERAVSEYRATTALERQEKQLSTLISNLPGMVYRCRNEHGWPMTFVSDGAEDLTGYDAATIENGDIDWETDVIVPAERDRLWTEVQSALDAGEPFEVTYRIQTADGERRWVWERGEVVTREDGTEILEGFITDITVRKERERELEEQRAFIENVLNSLDDLFYVVAPDRTFRRWNDRVVEVTGYSDEEIASMHVMDFVESADEPLVESAVEDAIETGSSRFEAAVTTHSGETIPFEFHGTTLHDADGDLVGIAGVAREVTERNRREQALRQYKTLTENVADPMYVMDPDGSISMVNEALADHVGYEREEIVDMSPEQFVADEDIEHAETLIQELLTTDREMATFEMRTTDKWGHTTHNETKIAVMTDEDGNFEGTAGVVRDISERKERERELARYETILQAVGDPVYTLDEGGNITIVNDAMEELSGYDRDELVGEHISQIMTAADVEQGERLILELLRDDERTKGTFEMGVITADGTNVPCENHVALLPADDDDFRGTAGVIRDISDRKQRERQLEQFASVVSHDLRSPLNVVQGRVDYMMESGTLDHLGDVADAAQRMERLIEDLLTLAHEGQRVGEPEAVAIDVVAEEAWDQIETAETDLQIETERRIEADFDRLRELFDNLFCNAIDHGDADLVRVVATEDGFAVADDGDGIPDDRRDAIFERGFTTSEDGTGFGLAIVETIVQAHEWGISITGSDAGGARFEIEI